MNLRKTLILKYQNEHEARLSAGGLNTDLQPEDSVGWFTKPTNKNATWRGVIERVWTPVHIEDGVVIGFEPKADFKAPSWRNSSPIPAKELRLT